MIDWADWLTWKTAKEFFNSQFTTSLLGAFAGAWGGAWAVQRIADKSRRRSELLQQIRNTNAAIDIVGGAFNTFANLKRQHSHRLKTEYDRQKRLVGEIQAAAAARAVQGAIHLPFSANLSTVETLYVRYEAIEEAALKNLSMTGRGRTMVVMLGQSLRALNNSIMSRNALIAKYNADGADQGRNTHMIFGIPMPDGSIDTTYGDTLDAIHSYNDDCLYFAWRLCRDLESYGYWVRRRYVQEFDNRVPGISRGKYEELFEDGTMPSLDRFDGWENNHYQRTPVTIGRKWHRRALPARRLGRFWMRALRRRHLQRLAAGWRKKIATAKAG